MAVAAAECRECAAARERLLGILRREGIRNATVLRDLAGYAHCPRHREGTSIVVLDDDEP